MKRWLLLFCLAVVAGNASAQLPAFLRDSLDAYITRGMKDWNIPGLAISIVKDGKVVFMKGYGVKEVGKKDPVDENTLFIIASNSKLFTGTAAARLEEEKKLSLNDKVTKYIPWFKLYDSNSTRLATVRDMLCHRIGVKTFQGDFTFWNSNLPKDSIIYKMRHLVPSGLFRQDYGYCNSAFLVAGQIIEKVSGSTWENYIRENMLAPLGMSNTFMNTAGMEKLPNVAVPYSNGFGELTRLPYDRIDNLGPATSMVSCVKDLSKWLMMQLDSGRYEGKTVLPWTVIQKTRDMNIFTGSRKNAVFPTHFRGYGLGVYSTDYNARQVYWHTGGAYGFVTNVCFVPEEKLGITILTNNDNQNFFEALRYQLLDAFTGMPYVNRSLFQLNIGRATQAKTEKEQAALRDRVSRMNPLPLSMDAFMGKYQNHVYGDIEISRSGFNSFKMKFAHHPDLTAQLEYMDNNEFRMSYSHPGYGVFPAKFRVKDGRVNGVEIKASDFVEYDPYYFIKK